MKDPRLGDRVFLYFKDWDDEVPKLKHGKITRLKWLEGTRSTYNGPATKKSGRKPDIVVRLDGPTNEPWMHGSDVVAFAADLTLENVMDRLAREA